MGHIRWRLIRIIEGCRNDARTAGSGNKRSQIAQAL